jgi:hypothetical protein
METTKAASCWFVLPKSAMTAGSAGATIATGNPISSQYFVWTNTRERGGERQEGKESTYAEPVAPGGRRC